MDLDSTILAISTPPGRSARGMIRCSGKEAFGLISHRLVDGVTTSRRGVHAVRFRLDRVSVPMLMIVSVGPASYTGDDTIELQVPGNPRLLSTVLECLLEDGVSQGANVRLARPGEFTARAFLSGRIGLAEAESVAALVAARSDDEIQAADLMKTGRLGVLADDIASALADALALVEAGIDFTDQEDVSAIEHDDLLNRIQQAVVRIDNHLERSVGLESLQALPWVVLDGPPNAGKSTLFNALLGRSRAVVSDIEGTTRDVLAEPMRLDGAHDGEILLVDVAGREMAESELEEAMQRAASGARLRAELRVHCVPPGATAPPPASDLLRIGTKADLSGDHLDDVDIMTSGVTREGLDELRTLIVDRLDLRRSSLSADTLVLAPRQETALRTARTRLEDAVHLLERMGSDQVDDLPELVAGLLRESLDAIGEINGVISPDEILDRVFSTFCIGK